MREHTVVLYVLGPWSLTTSRAFWEAFIDQPAVPWPAQGPPTIV